MGDIKIAVYSRAVVIAAAPIILFQGIEDSGGNYYDYDENGAYKIRYALL